MSHRLIFCLSLLSLAAFFIPLPVTADIPQPLAIRGGGGAVGFDRTTGGIVFVRGGAGQTSIARTPTGGDLWSLRLRGGQIVRAGDFLKTTPIKIERAGPQDVRLVYGSPAGGTVTVEAAGTGAGVDLRLSVKGLADDVLDAAVPDDLQFEPASLKRVLFPEHLGIALRASFYGAHASAASWDSVEVGPEGLRRVAGLSCRTEPLDAAPVAVRATAAGRLVLGADLAAKWEAQPHSVNRASATDPDVPLLTSGAGAYLGGHKVGAGLLVRFGGWVKGEDAALVMQTDERLLSELARSPQALGLTARTGRTRVVVLALPHTVGADVASLRTSPMLAGAGLTVSVADSPEALRAALGDGRTLAVVNPYGERFPAGGDPNAMLDAVHRFLVSGGTWLESGGYSFYYGLKANPYASLEDHYPSRAFSDFARIETADGSVSVYGIQNAHDAGHVFVPAAWRTVGDAAGGHLLRRWQTFLPKGVGGGTPPVRLRMADAEAGAALRIYAQVSGLDRPLGDKMPARTLALWKRSVTIKLETRTVAEEADLIPRLPSPALLHLVAYLHGGFDHQYPDHLPPSPAYGTGEQLGQLLRQAHRAGDLVMPYTNTTWWCDNPKGPTFAQAGDAPLLVRLDGQHSHEVYGPDSSGWTLSPFHSAALASVDRLVTQWTREYPVDVLFGDQNGARGLAYDLNPASPAPFAFTQGMILLAARAGAKLPVATEDGFDHLLNVESEFCGLTQELVTFPYDQDGLLTRRLPDADWEFFPLAQYVAHDKAFFIHHDLGAGVWDRDALLWSLALGYSMNLTVSGDTPLHDPDRMRWLAFLARVQATLGPHYAGAPLSEFRYLRGVGSRGVMEARYGDMRVVVNLSDEAYQEGAVAVAAHDFLAHAGAVTLAMPTGFP